MNNIETDNPLDAYTTFSVIPLAPTIGAEVRDIDLREELSDETIAELRAALLQFKVIFFRDQDITRDQHLAFGRRFGRLEVHPTTPRKQAYRELLQIAHGPTGKGSENAWHTDESWRENPSFGSILRAVEVPPVGGDTLFCDMYAAFEGLDTETQERISGLTAVHNFMRAYRFRLPEDQHEEMYRKYPPVEHPLVRTHPETGRNLIFVNIAFTEYIKELDQDESDRLLLHLWNQADIPEYQVRFKWQKNSIAFWDNRACQHYALSDYAPQNRVMERLSIAGDKPFYQAAQPVPRSQRYGMNLKAFALGVGSKAFRDFHQSPESNNGFY